MPAPSSHNRKITQLTTAGLIDGTEVTVVVQGGADKKVTVSNLFNPFIGPINTLIAAETARAEGVEAAKADLVSGTVPDSQIAAAITRDSELAASIATEVTNRNTAIAAAIAAIPASPSGLAWGFSGPVIIGSHLIQHSSPGTIIHLVGSLVVPSTSGDVIVALYKNGVSAGTVTIVAGQGYATSTVSISTILTDALTAVVTSTGTGASELTFQALYG